MATDYPAGAAELAPGYSEFDAERMLPEAHSSRRSDFARDRARVVHAGSLRRLSAKTQVLSPTAGLDFARNRLTHSLEVAQVGRELAVNLGLDPDVVDAACLAHDLGHPPFGHNGEKALDDWAAGIGGFEGNAQTLRALSRLEPKVFDERRSFGLNLTRASLDAACKYPWSLQDAVVDPSGRRKFGCYDDDREVFDWLRRSAPDGRACVEAQVMDLSDDVAYSVHDFEDAVVGGWFDPLDLEDARERAALVAVGSDWAGGSFTEEELGAALERLRGEPWWITAWDGSRRAHASLKNLTSQLIGRFAGSAVAATRAAHPAANIARYGAEVVVPHEARAEIAVLKGVVAARLMVSAHRQPIYVAQRELLTELADAILAGAPASLDTQFAQDWEVAADDAERRRVVVDQLAALTDQSATTRLERMLR